MKDKIEPIRVLQVLSGVSRGGVESRLLDIYRNIDRKRIQFDFLFINNRDFSGGLEEEIKLRGGKIFKSNLSQANIKNYFEIERELRLFFTEHPEYKIVHSRLSLWNGAVLKTAKLAGISARIAHSHTSSLGENNLKKIVKYIIKNSVNVNKYATHRFAVSQKAADWAFGKELANEKKIEIWANAVDCRKFRYDIKAREKMRCELGLNDAYTLIHVGNLWYPKNHPFLIDVFDELATKIPNSKLLIIGEDLLNGLIQKYAGEKKSADKIIFLGKRSDVVELLQAGDVFVFPSHYEGFPGAVLEAQAAGLPCVISDAITNEVCLTENIMQLPINKGTDIWVNKILEYKNTVRVDTYDVLVKKGYDIHTLCEKLCEFYENAVKNC